jgi:hypothetical protein
MDVNGKNGKNKNKEPFLESESTGRLARSIEIKNLEINKINKTNSQLRFS